MGRRQAPGTEDRGGIAVPSPSRLLRLVLVPLTCLLLASCWLPDRFIAEVRLARNGDYGVTFQGDMVWVPLAAALRAGEIKGEELEEKIAVLTRDLTRDPNFTQVDYQGNGRFKVRYEREGFLKYKDDFVFPRRNNPIISIETRGDGTAVIKATALKNEDKTRIDQAGLKMTGKFRVVTDAMPYAGNPQAANSRGFRKFMVYDWIVRGLDDPPPKLEVNMTRPVTIPPGR